MRAKRSLKFDDQFEGKSFDPSPISRKKSIAAFSPTTGTCRADSFSSPTTPKEQEYRNGPSNGKRKKLNCPSLTEKKGHRTKDNDEFLLLLSKIEKSSGKIMEIMQNLSSIQALEGNKELGNLIGVSWVPCFLKEEVEKTKELMTRVTKQKLFEKKSSKLPQKGT